MELLEWIDSNDKNENIKLTERKYFNTMIVGGVCLLTLIFGLTYVLMSKTVYFWDDSTYWDIGRMLAKKPLNLEFFAEIYRSIGTSDYNYAAAMLPSIWMKIFGVTRVSYILAIMVIYLIPTQIVTYLLAKRISKKPLAAYVVCVAAIPAAVYITVIGFVDIGGVLIGMLCYYLYLRNSENKSIANSVALGICLTLIMIFRRYYAFFSVSFITAMIIDSILIKKTMKNTVITVAACGLSLLLLFYPFFTNILLKDYGTLYASYKYNAYTDLKLITRYFGVALLAAAVAAIPISVVRKKDTRGLFAGLQLLVCAAMFMSTQTHGQQHLLLYIPALSVLLLLFMNSAGKRGAILAVCIAGISLVSPFLPRTQPQNIQEIKGLSVLPSYSVKPKRRDDVNEILSVRRKLDKKIPQDKKCGVLASSFVINSSILDNAIPSLNLKETREESSVIGLPEVDSRDYWRLSELYNCEYILVANPAQTHLAPSEQTIITEAVKSFNEHTDIAEAFSELQDFKASVGDVELKLYKRIKDVSKTAQTEFELKLYK